jgi:hypothetical protein
MTVFSSGQFFSRDSHFFVAKLKTPDTFGGVAQSTPHSPHEQKTRVRIPSGFKVYLGRHSSAVVYNRLNMHCLCVEEEK